VCLLRRLLLLELLLRLLGVLLVLLLELVHMLLLLLLKLLNMLLLLLLKVLNVLLLLLLLDLLSSEPHIKVAKVRLYIKDNRGQACTCSCWGGCWGSCWESSSSFPTYAN
jgi:hypothetical protein